MSRFLARRSRRGPGRRRRSTTKPSTTAVACATWRRSGHWTRCSSAQHGAQEGGEARLPPRSGAPGPLGGRAPSGAAARPPLELGARRRSSPPSSSVVLARRADGSSSSTSPTSARSASSASGARHRRRRRRRLGRRPAAPPAPRDQRGVELVDLAEAWSSPPGTSRDRCGSDPAPRALGGAARLALLGSLVGLGPRRAPALAGLPVAGVRPAPPAVLAQRHAVGVVALALVGLVVAPLAVLAGEGHCDSHVSAGHTPLRDENVGPTDGARDRKTTRPGRVGIECSAHPLPALPPGGGRRAVVG